MELPLDRPFLRSATPYLLPAGRAARIALSGAYFDQLDIQGLDIGTQQIAGNTHQERHVCLPQPETDCRTVLTPAISMV